MPTAGAGAEEANLAIVFGLRAHPLHGRLRVADHLSIGNATLGTDFRRNIVRVAGASALVEIGADREISMMREPTRRPDIKFAPAGEMMDEHDSRKRARTRGLRRIGLNRRSFVALEAHVPTRHSPIKRRHFLVLPAWRDPEDRGRARKRLQLPFAQSILGRAYSGYFRAASI